MVFWPFHGIGRRLTEKHTDAAPVPVRPLGRAFRRSLHFYAIDAGCDNFMNVNLQALLAPQYNTHRFGIFWADTPRHADVLILLGPPLPTLANAIRAGIEQLPRPCGVILVDGDSSVESYRDLDPWKEIVDRELVLARLPGNPEPTEILGVLLAVQGRKPSGGL